METYETMQKQIRINLNQLNEKQSRIYPPSEAILYTWRDITLLLLMQMTVAVMV
jgi:hypothetical protein